MRRTKRALAVQLVLQCLFAAAFTDASPPPSAVQYCWRPLSAQAVPHVAIIGTAKAGTTDMHMLLTRTSSNPFMKRMKEAKLLMESNRTLLPGHPDFHEYLERIGHPCVLSARPLHRNLGPFTQCMQRLATTYAAGACPQPAADASCSGEGFNRNGSLPFSIDATPSYLMLPTAMAQLRAISNETKVIVLLRHPVDRAQSLYNHRVNTEHNHNAPVRVQNHTISEWAKMFLDWVEDSPGVKPLLAALASAESQHQQAQLFKDLVQLNILGLPQGPLNYPNYNKHGHIERNLFGTALYMGGLALWRTGYFTPGRVMVVDAHEFFARRTEVINSVHQFVHGQPLSQSGLRIVGRTAIQNARRVRGIEFPGARLDGAMQQRLEDFYRPFNQALLTSVLPAMQAEGALIVGFDKPPWVSTQQH